MMEQKIKLLLFINIYIFILLTWICRSKNDVSTFSKSKYENCSLGRKLKTRNYRSLAKYKQNNDLNNVCLKEDVSNNVQCEKKDISNKEKNRKSNRNLLNKAQYYTDVIDYNNGMFDGKHFHFEKKLIKKQCYDDYLDKNKKISNIALKKIKFKSYGFGIAIFILFFLLGIGLPILRGLDLGKNPILRTFSYLWEHIEGKLDESLKSLGVEKFFLIIFLVSIVVLGAIIILTIPKILRNNEKYKKIKLMTE
ncbi:fam-m protein [Plasmodium malariae]|uniref:Fam-m protein n=1 Tax=Plasmodium malariae TaxID=5858 RepID=A0A1D3JI52_PLAMA|nr:fam-m protein [Plasmodium malariae]SBT86133.1 fam-m protein [Plasmodium malariae]